jgi:methylphosphotriester-DNA--protein-cysteine methyltransferase
LKAELGMDDRYLRHFCKRVTGVERVEWLSWKQARVLIGAMQKKLKYESIREVQKR